MLIGATPSSLNSLMPDLVLRNPSNPILSPPEVKPSRPNMQVECLLNPGVFEFDGHIWMVVRIAERPAQKEGKLSFPVIENESVEILSFDLNDPLLDTTDPREPRYEGETFLSTLSHLRLFKSLDGQNFKDAGLPNLNGKGELESYGIEDCRVASMNDGSYLLTYTATSSMGYGVGLRKTYDWLEFEELGMILPPANKDCAIFESKVNDEYFCFHRPSGVGLGGNFIWLAASPDLIHWGKHVCVAKTRKEMWDCCRVGAGAAPIMTKEGWLAIYHGADYENRYCLVALLLDANNPSKVLARSEKPLMEPVEEYELKGFFGNVVFTNGHVVEGDELTLYYGASDTVIGSAKLSIDEILKTL